MNKRQAPRIGVLLLCLSYLESHARETCATPVIISPAEVDITDAKPRFEWTSVANAKRYRFWLESRLPEGRVLSTHDIQTSATSWIPPAALTETRALLKVKLTAMCNEGDNNGVTPIAPPFVRFRIDTSVGCVIPSAPMVSLVGQQADVSWPAVVGADYYELSIFFGDEAKLNRKNETRNTKFQLESLSPGVWTIAVRPHCPSGYGTYRFKVLNISSALMR